MKQNQLTTYSSGYGVNRAERAPKEPAEAAQHEIETEDKYHR